MLLYWMLTGLVIWIGLSTWLNYRLLRAVVEDGRALARIRDQLTEFNRRHPFPPGDARAD